MNFAIQNLNREMIIAPKHEANVREKRFDLAIAKSLADQGWKPVVDLVTGAEMLPVVFAELDKKHKRTNYYWIRGAGRTGTLEACLKGPQHGLSEDDRQKIIALIDSGTIRVTVVTDATEKELHAIAADDDALKVAWTVVHRFKSFTNFKRLGYTDEAASRACGMGARWLHAARLNSLPVAVRVAWIEGKSDTSKPKLTDTDVKEIYDLQQQAKKENPSLIDLAPAAAEHFKAKVSGKVTPKATILSDKQLVALAQECVAARRADMATLVQLIRGYDPANGTVISNETRAANIGKLLSPPVEELRMAANKSHKGK
jgi:hypothetical protein